MALLETMHQEGHDYTFQQLRHFAHKLAGVHQEGVVESGDYDPSQRAAGANMSVDVAAGDAWVKMDTGTRNGLYLQPNDGVVNVPVGAAHAGNPRLDQLVLQINDTNIPAGAGDLPELKILPGTATAGATLDNRLGAAALGNDRILLGDILVPAAAANIVNANIRDRRPWARGAHWPIQRLTNAGGGSNYGLATTNVWTAVDAVNLSPRVECSGAPMRVLVDGSHFHATTNGLGALALYMDGVDVGTQKHYLRNPTAGAFGFTVAFDFTPPAGSHVFTLYWMNSTSGTLSFQVSATESLRMTVEEKVRQSASND